MSAKECPAATRPTIAPTVTRRPRIQEDFDHRFYIKSDKKAQVNDFFTWIIILAQTYLAKPGTVVEKSW
jgi:hypothetical protein